MIGVISPTDEPNGPTWPIAPFAPGLSGGSATSQAPVLSLHPNWGVHKGTNQKLTLCQMAA